MVADLKETNERLIGIIEKLAERYKDKDILKAVQKFKKGSENEECPQCFSHGVKVVDGKSVCEDCGTKLAFKSDLLKKQ
jgi:ribosomal protein L37AE/L43A